MPGRVSSQQSVLYPDESLLDVSGLLQQLLNRISKRILQKAAEAAVGQTRPEAAQATVG